ncbi:hypothetical protein EV360DRAFT_67775 [Lentinula raphanica]|nr:hypothetical protein EV360DRAFT_67775 [Lentinula raphanica]
MTPSGDGVPLGPARFPGVKRSHYDVSNFGLQRVTESGQWTLLYTAPYKKKFFYLLKRIQSYPMLRSDGLKCQVASEWKSRSDYQGRRLDSASKSSRISPYIDFGRLFKFQVPEYSHRLDKGIKPRGYETALQLQGQIQRSFTLVCINAGSLYTGILYHCSKMKISSLLSKSSLHTLSIFFLLVSPLGSIASPMLPQRTAAESNQPLEPNISRREDIKLWIIPDTQDPSTRNIGFVIGDGNNNLWRTYREPVAASDGVHYLKVHSSSGQGGEVVGSVVLYPSDIQKLRLQIIRYGYFTRITFVETMFAKLKDLGFTQTTAQEDTQKRLLEEIKKLH